ncbi:MULTISPECIES: protein rhiA [Rhizobium]|uniref:Protein rhiA n=1 Tax=Rhizobium rhododendri TaxID=2506430 RepID=A0ABY8IRA0_9HYPH|nr:MULTISPECIES: protein rhiA [Rhizobium]TQX84479.1 protein rhiA [Rhizobium sp. rho-13.1]TQY08173.1 protein rhiA [Rhizobium sp. rho-1.1]WFS26263.1 protein rhiA [Rhizobium rhododendri]
MTLHISYAKKEITDQARASQPASQALTQGTQYSLLLKNQSAQAWTFYVYQKMPQPVADVFSLAWFCSPYQIRVGNQIKFTWEIDYNFVWSDTGQLIPGVDFLASGDQDCSPAGANTTTFSLDGGPGLSVPVKGDPAGSLVIKDAPSVPNNRFSVGIGMSGTGTYVVQAGTNLTHTFTPTPSYWIAAGANMRIGSVLSIDTITQTSEAKFPSAVYNLVGTLQEDNSWVINPA